MKSGIAVVNVDGAVNAWRQAVGPCGEVAVVANPSYVACPVELYPLAPRNPGPFDAVAGIVMDMDGTTTTTEPLCLHSLEWMVRAITGRPEPAAWAGLDPRRDYPHIIGNSTTRHVEYLVRTYGADVRMEAFREAFVAAVAATLTSGHDEGRRREVLADAAALGLREMLADDRLRRLTADRVGPSADDLRALVTRYGRAVSLSTFADQVRAAVDIYYVRYHAILDSIREGSTDAPVTTSGSPAGRCLVAPMPAVGIFLALVKGWLAETPDAMYELLADQVHKLTGANPRHPPSVWQAMARWFARHPAPVSLVTSSIQYEADIVLGEVFRQLRNEAGRWPLPAATRERIAAGFASHRAYYDAYVTASDSSEIRLKPHRDLYSIALYRMGVCRGDYHRVIGLEDSESGVVAIRAAGVGCSVALPFLESSDHDFRAATHVVHGQLPAVLLNHACYVSDRALASFKTPGSEKGLATP